MKLSFKHSPQLAALVLIGLLSLSTACKRDKEDATDNTVLLNGTWKLEAMVSDPPVDWFGTPVRDIFAQLPQCSKDDLTTFNSNGTVRFDEGPSKCSPNDPQSYTATWTLSADGKTISVTENNETESWSIKEFSKTKLMVDYIVHDDDSGLNYTFTATYRKQ